MRIVRWCRILPDGVRVDGVPVPVEGTGRTLLVNLYRRVIGDYPKFFKMDTPCRAALLATELLVTGEDRSVPREDRAVLLFSRSGPLDNDRHFQESITPDGWFPSPSLFVYTLANIMTGEIAIRNRWKGDTSAFVLSGFDAGTFVTTVRACFADKDTRSAVCGWVECPDEDRFDVLLLLVDRAEGDFEKENIQSLYDGRTYQEPQAPGD